MTTQKMIVAKQIGICIATSWGVILTASFAGVYISNNAAFGDLWLKLLLVSFPLALLVGVLAWVGGRVSQREGIR